MKQNVTFIGAIENSSDRFVEKEYLLMVKSLRKNGGVYADSPVVLFQPTDRHILPRTLIELSKLNVKFIKNEKPVTRNTGRGFLNMPLTCAYLSSIVETEYMVWLDCDTLILQEPVFFSLGNNEAVMHCNMLEYDGFYNESHKLEYHEDAIAQYYLKCLFKGEERPRRFKHINTWIIQAHTKSSLWTDWKRECDIWEDMVFLEQHRILESEFVAFSGQGKNKQSLDYALSSVEEIAMGIIEMSGKYRMIEPIGTAHQSIDRNTKICHYDDWSILKSIYKNSWVYSNINEIEDICR